MLWYLCLPVSQLVYDITLVGCQCVEAAWNPFNLTRIMTNERVSQQSRTGLTRHSQVIVCYSFNCNKQTCCCCCHFLIVLSLVWNSYTIPSMNTTVWQWCVLTLLCLRHPINLNGIRISWILINSQNADQSSWQQQWSLLWYIKIYKDHVKSQIWLTGFWWHS